MEEIKKAADRHIKRNEAYDKIRDESGKHLRELGLHFRETMRNVALASGAVAAAAIASLNLVIPKSDILIISGSSLLLILSTLSFCYLLLSHWRESKSVMMFRRGTLTEMENLLNDFDLVLKGKLNLGMYLEREKTFENKGLHGYMQRDLSSDVTDDNIEIYSIIAFSLSMVLIIAGYLVPSIYPPFLRWF